MTGSSTSPLVLALAAAVGFAGCDDVRAGCQLSGSVIVCVGETFADCAAAGCSIGDFNCQDPPTGCEIAPGTTLARYMEKPPNALYLCGTPQATCGAWSETDCKVTVMTYFSGSIDYTIRDSTCL